jgi:Carboxypeptidase regulatory-like domain
LLLARVAQIKGLAFRLAQHLNDSPDSIGSGEKHMQSEFRFNRIRELALLALLSVAVVGLLSVSASADNLYASIRGTVTDPTGAVVSGVNLTATNAATGIAYSTTSNSSGAFTFLQLPIGDYSVKAEQTGFKAYRASGIHLDLDQIYNLPVTLTLGAASEQIIVEANPVQVEQTDMQLGSTITGQTIVDMPLNGRNWTQLQQLEPGIVGTSDRFGGGGGAFSGNGAETQQNSFLINGVDSNDSALNTVLVIPSPDAISEFRLITNTLNPEYGRNSGTIINATIKSGTNQFHGSAFEFYRDTFLDAKSYFDAPCTDALGNPKKDCRSPFHQNQFGGTIGGPIFKDKAFFFFSYQGLHQKIPQAAANTVNVFTTDQFSSGIFGAGAFDEVLTCDGVNPCTGNPSQSPIGLVGDANSPCPGTTCPAGTPYGVTYSSTGCTLTTCPIISNGLFSTGNIPTSNYNSLSTKLVNQFNAFNAAGAVQVSPTTTATDKQSLGRIDYKLTSNDSLWFYGLWETHPSQDTLPFTGTNLPGLPEQALRHYQQYSFSWTHTFSPTTLNEFRLGYLRFNFAAVTPVNPINPTAYGFTGITPQNAALASLPVISVGSLFTLGFSANGPQPRIQNVYQITDNFSKVWGHHTIKAGINADRPSINNPFYNNLGGNFSFAGGGIYSTGNGGADFLLGFPDSYSQGSGSIVDAKAHEIYAYVQDQWQIRPNLTITYGTGYDIETPWLNNFAHGLIMAAYRPGQQSTVFPTAPPGFVYPGDTGINKYGGMSVKYDLLAPRVGFAWSPTASRNWSVHGGIGLYYNRSEEELALQTLTNAPFAITTTGATGGFNCGSPGFANPFISATGSPCQVIQGQTLTNPFPFTPPAPGAKNIDFSQYAPLGFGFNTEDPRFTSPRSTNFNLTIERQLDRATILSVAYVGNRGRHEEGAIDLNLAGQAPGVNPIAANQTNYPGCTRGTRLATGQCPNPTATENADLTWTNSAPVPGGTPYDVTVYGHPGEQLTEFNSRYDSLQVTLNRRFSRGLQVLAAYTWSRYFDQTSSLENSAFNFPGINPFCYKCMWAPSSNDAPQRFVVSYTYALPIYSLTHRWKALTDGWNLSGIYTMQHGTPVAVFDFRDYGINYDVNNAYYAGPGQGVRTGAPLGIRDPRNNNGSNPKHLYFNPAAFTVPCSGCQGTASRNPLYGPGINYGDMALEKRIHIDESRYFELRLETYNTFNHTNFANPADPGFFGNEDVQSLLGTFGKVYTTKTISTNGEGRAIQLGAKFYF